MNLRKLSYRQALHCEQGLGKRCQCRCRGALHGRKRFGESPRYTDFAELPTDDPHRIRVKPAEARRPLDALLMEERDAGTVAHAGRP